MQGKALFFSTPTLDETSVTCASAEEEDEAFDILWGMVTEDGQHNKSVTAMLNEDNFADLIIDSANAASHGNDQEDSSGVDEGVVDAVATSAVESFERELRSQLKRHTSRHRRRLEGSRDRALNEAFAETIRLGSDVFNEIDLHDPQAPLHLPVLKRAMPIQGDPLPQITNFSPEEGCIILDKDRRKHHIKVTITFSGPLPPLPPGDVMFQWHRLVAYVEAKVDYLNRLEISSLDLSRADELTPFCFRSRLPYGANRIGYRFLCLVEVMQFVGADPAGYGIQQAVRVALKSAWNGAVTCDSQERPTFLYDEALPKTSTGETLSIRILSQLSEKMFTFTDIDTPVPPPKTVPPPLPKCSPAFSCASTRSEDSSKLLSLLPAPPAAMAMVAAVLPDFPNPPAEAVVEPDAIVSGTVLGIESERDFGDDGTKEAIRSLLLTDVPVDSEEIVQDALEATVNFDFVDSGSDSEFSAIEEPPAHPNSKGALNDSSPIAHRNRKRTSSQAHIRAPSSSADNFVAINMIASEWAIGPALQSNDETIGQEIDRHCKTNLLLKLRDAINGVQEGQSSEKDGWTIPLSVGAEEGKTGFPHSSVARGRVELPEMTVLKVMEDVKLDSMLDSLLVRVVENLVEEMKCNSFTMQTELNTPDKSGFTLLHYAALYNLQSVIPLLLHRGANPDTPTQRGKLTPLHLACAAGNFAIAEILVRHGSAVFVKDSFGSSPADHAIRNGFPDISSWLEAKSGGDHIKKENDRVAEALRRHDEEELQKYFDGKKSVTPGSSPMPPGAKKLLVQAALANLSLDDKVTLSKLVKQQQSQEDAHLNIEPLKYGDQKGSRKRATRVTNEENANIFDHATKFDSL